MYVKDRADWQAESRSSNWALNIDFLGKLDEHDNDDSSWLPLSDE